MSSRKWSESGHCVHLYLGKPFRYHHAVFWRIACSYGGVDLNGKMDLLGRWDSGMPSALRACSKKLITSLRR